MKKTVFSLCILLLATLVFAGGNQEGTKSEDVKIFHYGYLGALTGDAALFGVPFRYGTKFAIEEINANGGFVVSGQKYKMQLHEYDGRWDPSTEVAGANKMVQEGVTALNLCAQITDVQKVTEPAKILISTHGQPAGVTGPDTPYSFAVDVALECAALYPKTMARPGEPSDKYTIFTNVQRIAVITNNDAQALSFTESFVPAVKAKGMDVVFNEVVDNALTDYSTIVERIRQADPDLLMFAVFSGTNPLLLFHQMKEKGYKVQALGLDVLAGQGKDARRMAGPPASGIVEYNYQPPYEANIPDWVVKQIGWDPVKRANYRKNFVAKYGSEYDVSAAIHAYDFVYSVVDAAQKAGSVDVDAIRKYRETETPYIGAMARNFWFKDTHRFQLPLILTQLKDISEKTGDYTPEYLGGGYTTSSDLKNWEFHVEKQIDCRKVKDWK